MVHETIDTNATRVLCSVEIGRYLKRSVNSQNVHSYFMYNFRGDANQNYTLHLMMKMVIRICEFPIFSVLIN